MERFYTHEGLSTPLVLVASRHPNFPEDLTRALNGLAVRSAHHPLVQEGGDVGLLAVPDLLILSLSRDDTADPTALVTLAQSAAQIHCPVILAMPLPAVDHIPEALWTQCHSVLADPSLPDFAASISVALSARSGQLSDISRDLDADRLQRLADEVGRIARTLANISASVPQSGGRFGDMQPRFFSEPMVEAVLPSASDVRAMIRMRRLRERYFDRDLFADPAWDILLDLFAARLERVQVAVSSLCIAACVPPTTALRWIKMMTDQGILQRVADPVDGRRIFIRLSDGSAKAMGQLLAAISAAGQRIA